MLRRIHSSNIRLRIVALIVVATTIMTGLTFMNPAQVLAACPTDYPAGKTPTEANGLCRFTGDAQPLNPLEPDCGFFTSYKRSTAAGVPLLTCEAAALPSGGTGGGGTGNEDEDALKTDDCPIKEDRSGWWLCSAFIGINQTTSVFDSFINTYMTTGNTIFEGESKDQYKKAWTTFRNFGVILLVIAGLIMLISEVLGLAIVDAYTVRKVLPRLLIAIIGISLSWEFCKFVMGFFDDLGVAMGSIIYSSFGLKTDGIDIGATIGAYIFAGGATTATALLLGGMGLVSLMGTLLLSLLVAVIVLIVRQTALVALVLLAPIAIAAYVLPNTSKYANIWGNAFVGLLLLYPAATGTIALCKVLANITMGDPTRVANTEGVWKLAEGPNAVISLIVGIGILIAGYGSLPFLAQKLGGAAAFITNMGNDRSRGAFDRLKNGRKSRIEHNAAAMKAGNRFADRNPVARRFNRTTAGAATGMKGHFGIGVRGREAVDQVRRNASADIKKTAGFQAIQNDDDALRAATYNSFAEGEAGVLANMNKSARAASNAKVGVAKNADGSLWSQADADTDYQKGAGKRAADAKRAASAAKASIGFGRPQAIAATEQMVSTGTGYANMQDMTETIARASGGNAGTASSIAGFANSATKQVGRHDLAPGFGTLNTLVQDTIKNGGAAPSEARFTQATIDAARGVDNATLVRNKTPAIRNISKALKEGLETANNKGDFEEAARITYKLENIQQSSMYAPEQNVEVVQTTAIAPSQATMRTVNSMATEQRVLSTAAAIDPATNAPVISQRTGEVLQRRVMGPNVPDPAAGLPGYDAKVAAIAAQKNQRGYNPDDPNAGP